MNSRSKLLLLAVPAISLVAGLAIFPLFSASGYSYTYYVQPGDTLRGIGNMFSVNWQSIVSTNGLSYPYTIYVGEPLTIPMPSTSVSYVVQSGDTLRSIGQKFEADWTSLASANGLSYPYAIEPGQVLVIPLISAPGGPSGLSTSSGGVATTTTTMTVTIPVTSVTTLTSTQTTATTDSTTLTSTEQTTALTTVDTTSTAYVTSTSYVTLTSTQVSTATQTMTNPVTVTSTSTSTTTATDTTTQTLTTTSTVTSASDPLATGNPLYDQYDSIILAAAAQYNLDPMVLKAQIAQESYFDSQAVSPDDPCGSLVQNGVDVGHSYGLLQMTPVCISWFAKNPDGSVDLATSQYSSQWVNSAFNPIYNIYSAALDWYNDLQYAHQQFPGCSQDQYVYVGLSAYNAGFGSVYSCTSYNSQGTTYVNSVMSWYQRFSAMSGWSNPY